MMQESNLTPEEWAELILKNHPISKEDSIKAFEHSLLYGTEKWHIDSDGNIKFIEND